MKINTQSLTNDLLKQLKPIYWIMGDDYTQVDITVNNIVQAANKKNFSSKQKFIIETNFQPMQLQLTLYNQSLFTEKQIIEIFILDNKIHPEIKNILQNYLDSPDTSLLIIVRSKKLTLQQLNNKFFEKIINSGHLVQCYPLNKVELRNWLQQRAQLFDLRLTPDAIQLINEYYETNMLAIDQLLQRLSLSLDKTYDANRVLPELHDGQRNNLFHLSNALLKRNFSAIIKILASLQQQATEPLLILWAICRDIRLLSQLLIAKTQGETFPTSCQKLGIWKMQQTLFQQALPHYNQSMCEKILSTAHQIDVKYKTHSGYNIWQDLQTLYLNSMGIPLHENC